MIKTPDLTTRQSIFPHAMESGGRGVVIVGGGKFLPSGYLALRQLRHVGCSLPVELWFLGPAEFPRKLDALYRSLDATPIDAFEIQKQIPMQRLGGWECKPYAVAYSRFEEVLFIDADNLVLKDPTFLFDTKEYRETSAIFWPDFPAHEDSFWRIKPGAFELLNLSATPGLEIESGQLLIHKRRAWKALMTTVSMNEASDFFYKYCTYGDKDTFLLSWMLTQTPFFRVPHLPQIVRDFVRTQFAPDGSPLFEHGRKWVLPVEANRVVGPSIHDNNCFDWLSTFSQALYA